MAKDVIKEDDELKQDDDVEVVVEDDKDEGESVEDAEDKPSKPAAKEPAASKEKDLKSKEVDEDDDDDEEEEDEEVRRDRRRKEKLERKERRDKAIARDKLEMNFLRHRNEELERRMMAQELRSQRQDHYTIEQRIAEAEDDARLAEQVIAKAVAEANGDDVVKAVKLRDEAVEKIRQLQGYRDKLAKESKQPKEKQKVDPQVAAFAQEWMSKNSWYDSQGRDLDSRLVLAIDQSLVDEGYLPKTAQYWKELDRRVRAKLPYRYHDKRTQPEDEDESDDYALDDDEPLETRRAKRQTNDEDGRSQSRPKKGPAVGQSSESVSGAVKKREIYISKDRKEALIQAGVWDDPVLRMRYVKRYQQWDKDNSSR